jgi:murein DD-endopeptidase MepM/ murein hydrolase activator NlpD
LFKISLFGHDKPLASSLETNLKQLREQMTQRNKSAHNRLHYSWQRVPAQSLCLLSSFSLLSSGLVFAQTETSIDNIVPTIGNSQPTTEANPIKKDIVLPAASKPQPEFSERRATLKQRLRKQEVSQSQKPVRQSKPNTEATESVVGIRRSTPQVETSSVNPKVRQEKPQVEFTTPSRSVPDKLPEVAQPTNNSNNTATAAGKTKDYNNAYVDPNDYSTNTGGTYQAPNSVVITERSSGCRTILSSGQGISGSACAKTPQNSRLADSDGKPAPNWLRKSQTAQIANVPPVRQLATNNSSGWRSSQVASGGATKSAFRPNRFIPNPSDFATTKVSASPIAPSGGTLAPPMADGNVAPRPSNVAYDFALASVLPQIPYTTTIAYSGSGMMFPLSVPAPITSLFGWRTHPISGEQRFHAGTDLGAPTGTPVLAAAKGQVETANWMGGYGLAVVIQHSSAQQTLYGHMSELFVQPGQWVEPGTVIGRVGSTGNSTGPHLHFEVRNLSQDGWVAVDPGVQLQAGLSQLVQTLQTAQVAQKPGS